MYACRGFFVFVKSFWGRCDKDSGDGVHVMAVSTLYTALFTDDEKGETYILLKKAHLMSSWIHVFQVSACV